MHPSVRASFRHICVKTITETRGIARLASRLPPQLPRALHRPSTTQWRQQEERARICCVPDVAISGNSVSANVMSWRIGVETWLANCLLTITAWPM